MLEVKLMIHVSKISSWWQILWAILAASKNMSDMSDKQLSIDQNILKSWSARTRCCLTSKWLPVQRMALFGVYPLHNFAIKTYTFQMYLPRNVTQLLDFNCPLCYKWLPRKLSNVVSVLVDVKFWWPLATAVIYAGHLVMSQKTWMFYNRSDYFRRSKTYDSRYQWSILGSDQVLFLLTWINLVTTCSVSIPKLQFGNE